MQLGPKNTLTRISIQSKSVILGEASHSLMARGVVEETAVAILRLYAVLNRT
jgi:hypothetical protein